ncbi:MAG TPA: 50S ribosomal protein L11 methyltransferase [Thermoleophilaceae bacterium]|nr:50S ribosomal protein L11 methyltransferase [Thermoleophilaceae bacterium]
MIRLAVRAPAAAAEQVLAALLEVAPAGVEQVDGDGFVEFALYGAPGELPSLGTSEAEVGGVRAVVRGEEVADDWAERWRRFHRPVLVAGRLYVRPPWEEPAREPAVEDIVIDPGRAFGTGAHPTTVACAALLVELAADRAARTGRPASLADLGCGSGVLAIAAARLGFEPVTAVDVDPAALEATERNARANDVEVPRLERADLRDDAPPRADTVVANLTRPLLLRLAPRLLEAPPEAAIVSGLLDEEAADVGDALEPALRERRRVSARGWTTLLLERVARQRG